MMARFTDRARKVMSLASDGARQRGRGEISPVDMFAGLVAEGSGVGPSVLRQCGVNRDAFRRVRPNYPEVEDRLGAKLLQPGEGAISVLTKAAENSQQLGHNYVGTEHVLLGLLESDEPELLDLLRRLNVDPARVRDETISLLRCQEPTAPRCDAAMVDQLAQVVERMRSTIAELRKRVANGEPTEDPCEHLKELSARVFGILDPDASSLRCRNSEE